MNQTDQAAAMGKRVLTSRLAAGSADPHPPQPAKGEVASWVAPVEPAASPFLDLQECQAPITLQSPSVQVLPASATLTSAPMPAPPVNAPITLPQWGGAFAADFVTFLIAALPGLIVYLSGVGPFAPRALLAAGLTAILAGLLAVQHATGTTPLMLGMRARGQLRK